MATGTSDAAFKIATFEADLVKANSIVNGSDAETVTVDSGECPTFRKTMADLTTAFGAPLILAQDAAILATTEADRAQAAADIAEAVTGIVPATETAIGIIQVATEAETKAETVDNKAVSPKNLGLYVADLRTATPTLTLPSSANEGEVVTGSYTVPDGATPVWSIPVAITDFVDDNADGFTFTGPNVDIDTDYTISVSATKQGQLGSEYVSSVITVLDVEIQDGPTVTYANTVIAWPDATIDSEAIDTPAYSVGALNTNQIVSGKMEAEIASGKRTVLDGTTSTFLKVLEELFAGDMLITDQGNIFVRDVTTLDGGSSCVIDLPLAPTKAFKNPLQGEKIAITEPTTTGFKSTAKVTEGEPLFIDGVERFAGGVVESGGIYTTAIEGLTEAPTHVSRRAENIFALGVGITGEHIGLEEALKLGTGSTTDSIVTTSTKSQKDKIYITGGLHNNLLCDGVLAKVASVSENSTPETGQSPVTVKRVAGGISVGPYLNADGVYKNIIFAPASQRQAATKFGLYGTDTILFNMTSEAVPDTGTGAANTATLTSATYSSVNDGQGSVGAPAATYCAGLSFEGCSDFFLPSKEEMNLAYQNKALIDAADDTSGTNLAGMGTTYAWTSSEYGSSAAWIQNFSVGNQSNNFKYLDHWVIPARSVDADPVIKTTANLVTPLATVPTSVAIPDRYTLETTSYTSVISGDNLIITGDKIDLPENHELKQIAMAVHGPVGLTFKDAKIYIQERL